MVYFPHTDDERTAMLAAIGCPSIGDLFSDVPKGYRFPALSLPEPLSELELEREMQRLAFGNRTVSDSDCFLGAGAYNHFVPSIVGDVLRRSEFYTSYTPYQPEVSQGMLQAMYEYQSMICRLTGMEVSNASHYDGATSLAEAVFLALNVGGPKRNQIVVFPGLNPQYVQVLNTYLRGRDEAITTDTIASDIGEKTAAVVVQSPNFFGQFETLDGLAETVHAVGALLIVIGDPIAMGLFKPPGDFGADVVVADGQPLGSHLSFGGPHLGIFTTRRTLVRKIAGRLVGETVDTEGSRGYVLTLATREQHIRRAKATSNICTNAALTALAAAVYLAALGKHGLRSVAELCYRKSHYAAARIEEVAGLQINPQAKDAVFFKEFVVDLRQPANGVCRQLTDQFGLVCGYDLGLVDPAHANHLLVAVTEMNKRESIDRLADALKQVTR
ncbi:MAG: aminomethyl-transferring glycine dehydrogenase subunit GcvPA [Hyphomicrobiales bacterium]|nr:aminomethyl-transferring glycine dehydrogenase subunit GcvPA [Hyphomicrobiales bacterium]MCP5001023.1 aminomethyl-transferring glycine dehydrogenase subunit GcvPA [Hyphomicrobiales bacterium]